MLGRAEKAQAARGNRHFAAIRASSNLLDFSTPTGAVFRFASANSGARIARRAAVASFGR